MGDNVPLEEMFLAFSTTPSAQNIVLALAEVSGIGWITSQCSTTLPPSSRKMSTTASPRGLSDRPCQWSEG